MIRFAAMDKKSLWIVIVSLFTVAAACTTAEPAPSILVSLVADGRERTFELPDPITVDEFLRDPKVGIELGELDRVSPDPFIQISDGMRVTVVRVTEESECEQNEIPYSTRTVLLEGLEPGEERLGQAGQNGVEEVCYRVIYDDGILRERIPAGQPVVITEPQDEVIWVGPTEQLDPVQITGTLSYISNNNAWIMHDNSRTKRPLTVSNDLDPRVFSLSPDGNQLLFTRESANTEEGTQFNELWLIPDTGAEVAVPLRLPPADILYADWVPNRNNTISYSTGEARDLAPGWWAFNDLWIMRFDPRTGDSLEFDDLVQPSNGGLYGWWGTKYQWSPDGENLAWIQAESVGTVDLDSGDFTTLLTYPVYQTQRNWSWRATVSWSFDSSLLITTVHGAPVGNEQAESSPAFDIAIVDVEDRFQASIIENAGIWSAPRYSPPTLRPNREFPTGFLAYLRAREPFNSVNGEYDLYVADRDGSNSRKIFPPEGQSGLTADAREFAWSPDGQQIAVIHLGNLWVVDVETAVTHQLTVDGGASQPRWAS